MSRVGVVVIGRNEGERLRRCLESVLRFGPPTVYVDSNSTDGSVELARRTGVDVVHLDMSVPFTAARARNAGFERLARLAPGLEFVQFIDGDCELRDGWLDRGVRELDDRPQAAVVFGRLRERSPEASVYNRLADIEWDTPIGEATACGGISMMRVAAFRAAGGFDPTVPAGEEPELCRRLRDAGWKVFRIDAEMVWHDSAMTGFRQWWKRSVRSGYGWLDVFGRFGPGPGGSFKKQVVSARYWTVGWLSSVLAQLMVALPILYLNWRGPMGVSWALVLASSTAGVASLPLLNAIRLAFKIRRRVPDRRTALAYGLLTMLGKWAGLVGQIRWIRDRLAGRNAQLIEHKPVGATPASPTLGPRTPVPVGATPASSSPGPMTSPVPVGATPASPSPVPITSPVSRRGDACVALLGSQDLPGPP